MAPLAVPAPWQEKPQPWDQVAESTTSTAEDPNATHTSTTVTTTSRTATSTTSTTRTTTSTTSTITTTTGGSPVFGGDITEHAFKGWLSIWRNTYKVGLWNANLSDPWESLMPQALKHVKPKVVLSSGGVAGGVVTEGMGYGIMIEGMLAAAGDTAALK